MKRIISSILSVLMIISGFSVLGTTALAEETIENTIEIWNVDDLYNVRNNMSANYVLMADIDMSKEVADGGKYCYKGTNGWEPIGSKGNYSNTTFTGEFNGNNHIISGLRIEMNTSVTNYNKVCCLGLFANNSGIIKNLSLSKINIEAVEEAEYFKNVGAISGQNSGLIENCHILNGSISIYAYKNGGVTDAYAGGISGYCYRDSFIKKCSNNCTIKGSGYGSSVLAAIGGISGINFGSITTSYNSGNLCKYSKSLNFIIYEGGIAGQSSGTASIIDNCYNSGDIYNETDNLRDEHIFAISGTSNNNIKNCYNVGLIHNKTATKDFDEKEVTNCYFLENKNNAVLGTNVLSESQFQEANSFSGFDFENTWTIDNTADYVYPQIRDNRQEKGRGLDTVEFKVNPSKTEFFVGDKISSDGILTVYYLDGSSEDVYITSDMLSGYDMSSIGNQNVTVNYRNRILTYEINIKRKPKVTSIKLISEPNKTEFIRDTKLDYKGAVARIFYDDDSTKDVELSPSNTTGADINKSGTYTVTYTYEGYSIDFKISVVPLKYTGLEVKTLPSKTTYIEGQSINTEGLDIILKRNDGSYKSISNYKLDYVNEPGKQKVTVIYDDYKTYFYVLFDYKVVESISVTKSPLISSYVIGSDFDKTGMEVTAYYNDGTSKVVTDYYVSSLPTTLGEGTVKVSYGGKSTTINVTIKEKALVKIKVTAPKKTTYFKGEQLDTTGMVVYAVYNNKESEPITDYVLSGFGDSNESNLVTVSYKSLTASFEVFIHNPTGEWINTKEATCENAGEKVMYCTTCSEIVKREEIKALNHDYSEKVVKPTCTEKGYTEHTCKNCGDTYRDSYVKETGHNPITDYGKPATCKENGLTDGSHCNVCGTVLVPQQIIPKLNHSYTAQVTSVPSCTTRGSVTYTCQSCGDSYVVYQEASNHNFKLIKTVNATCTTPGYKQYACTECNENYREQIPITDHKPVVDKAIKATCVKTGLTEGSHCSECGAVIIPQELVNATGHSYTKKVVAPTCKDKGYTVYECTKCKDSYIDDYKDTVGHDYVTTVTTPATCKKTGVKTSTCSVCGDKFTTTIPMIDHKEVTDKAVAPTCTKTGLTEGSHCSVCGDVITEQKVVKPLDHNYVASVVEPTCTSKGYTLNTCTMCGESYKSDYVDTVEHQYKSTVAKQPTCTEEGIKKYTCTVCGDTYNESIPKTEHKYSEKVVAPTCTTDGYTLHTCDLCGDSYKDTITQKVDHSYNSVVTKEPTCTEDGIKKYTCTVCGDTYSESISKTGHKYSEKVVAPTCTTDGYTLHTCDLCGDSYKDSVTQKVDHNYNSVVTKEATCTEEGVKKYTCTVCGDTYSESISKTGHKYSEKVVAPTCTTDGYTLHTCDLCGDSYKDSVTQKVDHNYNSVVTKEATCTEEGVKKYTCPTCGDTYTVKIPMSDHTVVIDKAVSATYTAYGKTEGSHCSVCGKVIKEQKKIAKKKLAKPTGVKATAMSKSFKLNWKKVSGAKGYEIQYSYKSNFSDAKKVAVKSGNTTSQTVKKLTGKKKVFIRIRTYYNDKNGKVCSAWTVINVTTKK